MLRQHTIDFLKKFQELLPKKLNFSKTPQNFQKFITFHISSDDDEDNYSLKIHKTERSLIFILLDPKRSSGETGQKP